MKKKLLTGLFLLVALLALSVSASALTEGDWEFKLLDDQVVLTDYIGAGGDVVIPDSIFGAPVVKIEKVFSYKDPVTSIVIPDTVKEIADTACSGLKVLETVTMGNGVEIIGDQAFNNCPMLKSVKLSENLKEVGPGLFEECVSLKTITLPASLEKIGDGGFHFGIFQESGLETIDLSHITAPLGSHMFKECKNLKSVKLNPGLTKIPEKIFYDCKALEEIDIPGSVTEIGVAAFSGCSALKSVILPHSLKVLQTNAFSNCTALKEVVIPYGTEKVFGAFPNCANLKAIYMPDTVKETNTDLVYKSDNCIIYCTQGSYTAEYCKKRELSYLTDKSVNSLITVYYNGTRISFHTYDQNPELINDRTLVPLRSIFEAMGADVTWDGATSTATSTRDGVTVSIRIGADSITKNGQKIPVDVPAQIVNDRTMIPVRVIAEAFGADVTWNGNGKAVLIEE